MGLLHCLLLWGAAALLLLAGGSGSSSHSLQDFFTFVTEPSPGLPWFTFLKYVDDQPFVHYDSNVKKLLPVAPWAKKVKQAEPHFWENWTQRIEFSASFHNTTFVDLRDLYNHSEGFHTMQMNFGCSLSEDGQKGWNILYGYDGRDYLSLDRETLNWTAGDKTAEVTKRQLETTPFIAENINASMEQECIRSLQKFVEYGKESLHRTEPPVVKVAWKTGGDSPETLVCRVHGFYPKEIDVIWKKDGVYHLPDALSGGILPNSDGTYYTWLSTEIESKDRDRYQCQVEHSGLLEPLDITWNDSEERILQRLEEMEQRITRLIKCH
ncbi:major histocompatibility complex class I-related gene protein-like isoform X2 [Eublepharis macularius]|uniref:Major histocompatibility complex class I-related gene protein-like isoform X2 n=1 Tax=Eublepharis macularius TaxID=481883 RepID=A0AA97KWG6_EUBMA|nr:major histocompatibility complex class I-related gene protein-like isoform X2 [Eublepharis macularius]